MADFHATILQFQHEPQWLVPVTQEELTKAVRQCTSNARDLDPCPPHLHKKTLEAHFPYLAAVVNDNFERGLFPKALKTALVRTHLRKEGLDVGILANY